MKLTWCLLAVVVLLAWLIFQQPGTAGVLAGLILVSLGIAVYAAVLDRPGPYAAMLFAMTITTAGFVLVFAVVSNQLELLLVLWPIAFPIGLGFGWWTWHSLDPEGANAASVWGDAPLTILLCLRAGLALVWVLIAWTYLVLNVPRATGTNLQVQNAKVLALGLVVVFCYWSLGKQAAWNWPADYYNWLKATQFKSRTLAVRRFTDEATNRVKSYEAFKQATGTRAPTRNDQKLLPTKPPVFPDLSDQQLQRAELAVASADWRAWKAAVVALEWNKSEFDGALQQLEGAIAALQTVPQLGYTRVEGQLRTALTPLCERARSLLDSLRRAPRRVLHGTGEPPHRPVERLATEPPEVHPDPHTSETASLVTSEPGGETGTGGTLT